MKDMNYTLHDHVKGKFIRDMEPREYETKVRGKGSTYIDRPVMTRLPIGKKEVNKVVITYDLKDPKYKPLSDTGDKFSKPQYDAFIGVTNSVIDGDKGVIVAKNETCSWLGSKRRSR